MDFWSCGFNTIDPDSSLHIIYVRNFNRWTDVSREYQVHMVNFTDTENATFALVKTSDTDVLADWADHTFATSTECHPVRPTSCEWTQD